MVFVKRVDAYMDLKAWTMALGFGGFELTWTIKVGTLHHAALAGILWLLVLVSLDKIN
jgi:hypothetical protein